MRRPRFLALLLSFLLLTVPGALALAQEGGGGGGGSTPGPEGPQGPPGPPGPSGVTIFGMDQNTALLIGGLILVLVVILAIVSVSNKGSSHRV